MAAKSDNLNWNSILRIYIQNMMFAFMEKNLMNVNELKNRFVTS